MRLQRDQILGEAIRGVLVTRTPGRGGGNQEMVALPLKFIPGWLFGISVNRVRDELRDRILRYQRECYDALWEAFQEGRLTAEQNFEALLQQADPDVVQAYQIARAVVRLARNQVLMEARLTGLLDNQQQQLKDHEVRLEELEMTLGDPGRVITPAQAARISQAVKAIALELGKKTGRNEFGGVYGEFYRRFEIPGYRELPASRFERAMKFLGEWWRELTGSDQVPF
jgi:hypothetical protein